MPLRSMELVVPLTMTQEELDAVLKRSKESIERMQKLASRTQDLLKDKERLHETILGQAFTDKRATKRESGAMRDSK